MFAGKVGTGFDTKLLTDLRAHWVRPEIVVHVAFIEWSVHMKLRHSRLLGIVPTSRRATSFGSRRPACHDICVTIVGAPPVS